MTVVLSLWKGQIPGPGHRPTMAQILDGVAMRHCVTPETLKGYEHPKRLAHVRWEAMALMFATGRYSKRQIGRFMGGRDHSSVVHGIRQHEARLTPVEGVVHISVPIAKIMSHLNAKIEGRRQ